MSRPSKVSRLRQRLNDAADRYLSLVEGLVGERGPLLQGSFLRHGTRCGKPNCKCTQGELHNTAVLSVSEDGKRRSIYVRPPDRLEVERRTDRYRRFRRGRSELVKLHAEIVKIADELLASLLQPYVPKRNNKHGKGQPKRRTKAPRKG
jgi:hypothetical protein